MYFLFECSQRKGSLLGHLFFFLILTGIFAKIWFINPKVIYADEIAGGYVTDTEGNRCGSLQWSLSADGTFIVTGTGPGAAYRPRGMEECDRKCPWDSYRGQIKRVQFNCVFTGASLYHFEYGASLNSWFINCINLESYSDIPYGVTDLSATFMGCSNLKECGSIPDSVVTMQYTFSDCRSLVNPPQLPTGLRDDVYQKYQDENILRPASGLGLTFSGCSNLITTPDFTVCPGIDSLVGTFVDCTGLVTIQNIPANINYLFDSFHNCSSVRGVFSCEAEKIILQGNTFGSFSQNNDYILFIKANDPLLTDAVKLQAGDGFRGYGWDEVFSVFFDTNGGDMVEARKITMEYGSNYGNEIDLTYKSHISQNYYQILPEIQGELPWPYKRGLVFDGWYYDRDFKQPVSEKNLVNPSNEELQRKYVVIYAKWKDIQLPDVLISNLDKKWYNEPVTINFDIWDNVNGGIAVIRLFRLNETGKVPYENVVFDEDGIVHYRYQYTFGRLEDKVYEGMQDWEIYVEDYSGNNVTVSFQIGFDYTPPVIYTDSPYDDGSEIIYDNRNDVNVWCEDSGSGPAIIRINPSDIQNTFIDMISTPYKTEADYTLHYIYGSMEKEMGYVLYAADRAGNTASRIIITDRNIGNYVRRIIPRENYD